MKPGYKFKWKYNPNSNRLQDHDYSSNWWYFITICTKNRENYFGEIIDWKMILNEMGEILNEEIKNINSYNEKSSLDKFIIMPNHLHIIIIIDDFWNINPCIDNFRRDNSWIVSTGKWIVSTGKWIISTSSTLEKTKNRRKMIIPKIVWKFKMITSKQINILRNSQWNKLWQPNYYDRIIRNEDELTRIRKYIIENPLKWELDKDNVENIFM